MLSTALPEQPIVQSLVDALNALPGLRAELRSLEAPATSSGYRPDAEVALEVAGRHITLRVEAKRELFPRGCTRSAVAHGRFGWRRQWHADPSHDRRGLAFTGRRAQVIHALLLHPREWLTGKDLAERAQVSTATVSQVMTELERLEFISLNEPGPHKGRQVREPGRLLDQWAKYVTPLKTPALRRYFLPALRAEQLLEGVAREFATHNVSYAVSFEAAAQAYAPFLSSISQVKCRAMPGAALESGLAALSARVVEEGVNFSVLETKSASDLLFREQLEGSWLASPIQVYLDLLRSEGRAKELAQHLRRERIRF